MKASKAWGSPPRPLWRWWLFGAALSLWWRTGCRWRWLAGLFSWCVLPEWLSDAYEIHDELADRMARELACGKVDGANGPF